MIQLILLGKQKMPWYTKGYDWHDRLTEEDYFNIDNFIKHYHIAYNSNYHVGDGFTSGSYKYEVFGVVNFENENKITDWLEENYPDIKEI
jgi:hypothetical protein